jgi:protein-disulfide isomerase
MSKQTTSPDQPDTIYLKKSHFKVAIPFLTFIAGIIIGYVVWGVGTNEVQAAQEQPPQKVYRYDIPIEGAYFMGRADAPITIVEFSDYQCPYCKKFNDEVFHPLLERYPEQIKFVYRNLPLTSIHDNAVPAAEAAMCAGEQGSYWQFHEMLFEKGLGDSAYRKYAQELGLNITAFSACLADHRYQETVIADSEFAADLGIRSTPTFFINGLAIVGAQPLEVFEKVIDAELAGEIEQ